MVLGATALMAAFLSSAARAQTPLAATMTTAAGSAPMAATSGTQCPNLPTGVKSTDTYGDGCLAVNGIFGAAGRGGVQVDAFGNLFIDDDVNSIVHVVNPTTGIMTLLAGKGTACSGKLDAAGDNCIAATATVTSGQRGVGIDPYGNVLLGGYSDNLVHIVCRTVSPNCTAGQVGYMELVAGCSTGTGSNGTGGLGASNVAATKTSAGTCSTAYDEVGAPRGAAGDIYGNIYFADTNASRWRVVVGPLTSPFFTGNNPLYAALGVVYPSVTAGYAYTVVNTTGTCSGAYGGTCGGTATVKGNSCSVTTNSVTYTGTALDIYGDGCPFNSSSDISSSGYTSGLAVDAAGNLIIADPTNGVRVLFISGSGTAGAAMVNAIEVNNTSITAPQPGFLYTLIGGGTLGLTATPQLGSAITGTAQSSSTGGAYDSAANKIQVSPQGNIYVGDSTKVIFFDMTTGYARLLFTAATNVTAGNYCNGTSGQKSLDAYSDGCPVANSAFVNSNGLGVAIDSQSNLYLYDATPGAAGMLVRKVLAQSAAPRTVAASLIQNYTAHFPETSAGGLAATATLSATPDSTASAATCNAQNADFSFDCTATVTSTPTEAGIRSATLSIAGAFTPSTGSPANSTVNFSLGGPAAGSALAFDSASTTASGTTTPIAATTAPAVSGIQPYGVALDGAANIYVMDATTGHFLESIGGTTYTLPGTLPSSPGQIAVDELGNVYAAGSGTSSIVKLAVTGPATSGGVASLTATTLAYTPISGTATPQGVAVDNFGNVFVADKQSSTANTAVYRISTLPSSAEPQVTVATGFSSPSSLAVDPSGNVYVVDQSTKAVYKLTPGLNAGIPGYVQTTLSISPSTSPVSVATDAAGNVYVQDAGGVLYEVPVTGGATAVFTGLNTPDGVAVDGAGNVYSSDFGNSSITKIIRNATAFNFGTSQTTTYAGTLSDVGNIAVTGQNTSANPNTTNFNIVAGTSNGCTFSSNVLGAMAIGNACTLSATFIGSGSGPVSDPISFLPLPTTGSLTLTGTLQGTAIGTTTTISGQTPASPNYSPSGTEVTFTVTVAPSSGTTAPGGNVAVTVTNTGTSAFTTTNYALTASGANGVATVALSGLAAGSYIISAAYPTSGSFTASSSGNSSFSIGKNATSVSWTPGTTSHQYGAPVGTAVLDASATYSSAAVPGVYVYTANGTEINAATYLAIGSYSLGVTFYPTDSVDYTSSIGSVASFSMTQATTTAPIGATQNLVAADGTGNFTSLQTAINTLSPTTGGSIYIKPGTYTGFVTVVTPFVSLYGLGGAPANVILTNEDGAFSSPYPTGAGAGNNGSQGDQGSATMVVARGAITGVNSGNTYTPYNFYAENLSIINTYDTSSTLDYNYYNGSTCSTVGTATPRYQLYNSGNECNSQALAIWITGDQAVLNNVYTTSQQDTIYAGAISGSSSEAARQYWFRGKVTGDVDYIFGDAAAVFDRTSIYTTFHGTTATGTETIEAQNKKFQTGSGSDYLSGYIMNSNVFTSQAPGMTALYFGRPYGTYSTWVMLNSYVDQVAGIGYIEFSGDTNLPTSTYTEYNNQLYTDPATNSNDLNGVPYLGSGGSSGSGVTSTRETTSTNPGTIEAASGGFQTSFPTLANTTLSQIEAQQYYPIAFLGTTVATNPYNNGVTNWNPTTAIATNSNAFATGGAATSVTGGTSVTILMRPATPGLGAVSNGVYTIPTGTYTLSDTYGTGSATVLATGSLDAAGEAYYTTSTLNAGTHHLTWTYGGDSNFAGSTSSSYTLAVTGTSTTTSLSATVNPITYGQTANIVATVTATSGTATGSVTLTIDGTTTQNATLSSGAATFSVTGLTAGNHSFSATYNGAPAYSGSSTTSNYSLTVNQASITVTGTCADRYYNQPNVCSAMASPYQYTDSAVTVFTTLTATTTSTRDSAHGNYTVTPVYTLTTFGAANYTVSAIGGTQTVTGGSAQSILFAALPNFPHGATYQLTARTTSGLPVAYTITSANGNASIVNGNSVMVTGTGVVTIQATTPTDPTGDYATATPVSQSFTAQ
jgi:pectin methylesterase-like acyl-CoA thioesterase